MENQVKTKKNNPVKDIYELLDSVIISAVCVLLIFTLLFRIFIVSGPSMDPTLADGERLIVSNLFYEPKQGDIICFYSKYRDEVLVKRVIATEGQTVDLIDGLVYVDGKELDEDYIGNIDTNIRDVKMPHTVKEGCVFALGDNRSDSLDSRYNVIGDIDKNDILGKLILRLFPRFGTVK